MKITLQTPISELPRVGKVLTNRLKKLGLNKVEDLLFYYPYRYDDFSQITKIVNLKPNSYATIKGKINLIANKRSLRKRMYLTESLTSDNTATIKAIWFNQPFITRLLKQGDNVYFSGKVEYDTYGLQFINPSYEKVKSEQIHTARIIPIYSTTEKLTEKQIRFLIKKVLPLAKKIPDWLPEEIKREYNLINLSNALLQIHFPFSNKTLKKAEERLKFNELFLIQLKAQFIRAKLKKEKALPIKFNQELTKKFVDSLSFKLTNTQKKAAWEIIKDLEKTSPMNRLLEGDVGSGKTIVACLVILNVINNGYQVALMAPTEILAKQHYKTITTLFNKFSVPLIKSSVSSMVAGNIKPTIATALLTRAQKKINNRKVTKKSLLQKIESEKIHLIIGTHALIQEDITFNNLALVIIDEQHRFGVEQRKKLKQKTQNSKLKTQNFIPHLLSMTATPIPRSLALTLYGDLDLSIINEMPADRKKVLTKIVPPEKRKNAYQFIKDEIKSGRQIFVICPLIDPSDKLGVKAVSSEYEKLKKDVFPEFNIGLLHGKLKTAEKEKTMKEFASNKINILVSTSVVEVGIDIPNASTMMIEGAERFGLAQLHQFRGRVGRSEYQSYCFLFTESDSLKIRKRLEALVTSRDGFELAEKDLEFMGPGEIFGLAQSGFPEMKIAKLTDYQIIKNTKQAVEKIFAKDSQLNNFPLIKQKLIKISHDSYLE